MDSIVGLFLIVIALLTLLFPPKFGNVYYGMTTKLTLKNETMWATGQKLFAFSILVIGLIFFVIGNLHISNDIPKFSRVILLIGLWSLSKYIVHKTLEKKYPTS